MHVPRACRALFFKEKTSELLKLGCYMELTQHMGKQGNWGDVDGLPETDRKTIVLEAIGTALATPANGFDAGLEQQVLKGRGVLLNTV